MELKKISHSRKNIEDSYIRAVSTPGMEDTITMLYQVINSDDNWIANYIRKQSKIVQFNTRMDFDIILDLVRQQFLVNAVHSLEKNSAFLKRSIKDSADYVQSVLFSDMAKELEAIKGQSFINEDELNDTKMEISIKETQKELAEDLINQLFTRKDQKAFVLSVITNGKEYTMNEYGYSEKRFNERIKKVEATMKKAYENGDNDSTKSLVGEILETAVYDTQAEMTVDDEIAEMYQNTTHQSSFYF